MKAWGIWTVDGFGLHPYILFPADKACLEKKRGQVVAERRRDIARKIIQGLAIAGL